MHKALSIMINSGSFLSHFYLKMEVVKIYFLDLVYFTFEIWVFKSETKRGYNTTTKYILRLKYGEKFWGKKIADCFWHGSFGFYLYIKKFCWPSVQITTLAALRAKLLSFMDVLKMSDDSHFGLGTQWSIWKNLIRKIAI